MLLFSLSRILSDHPFCKPAWMQDIVMHGWICCMYTIRYISPVQQWNLFLDGMHCPEGSFFDVQILVHRNEMVNGSGHARLRYCSARICAIFMILGRLCCHWIATHMQLLVFFLKIRVWPWLPPCVLVNPVHKGNFSLHCLSSCCTL